jgi:hypothetical protein
MDDPVVERFGEALNTVILWPVAALKAV